jgi:hypothetical protein
MAGGEMQCDRAADGNARQRDFSGNSVVIEQGRYVVGHRVDGECAAYLLRQARPAAVVSQHPTGFRKPSRGVVPAFERAAHFVHQHQRALTPAVKRVAQPGAVDLSEFHAAFP